MSRDKFDTDAHTAEEFIPGCMLSHFSCGENRVRVDLTLISTHDGLIGYLSGGERPHVGATVMSVPRPSLQADGTTSCDSTVVPRPGHKDYQIAQNIANSFSTFYNTTVCIVAGVHSDDATEQEIASIEENCEKLIQQVLAHVN